MIYIVRKYITALFVLAFSFSADAMAQQHTTHTQTIKKIEDYFAQLKTYEADFVQINPDRTISKGKFFLERPDRFRLAYSEPKETVLISDGLFFIEYDPKDNIPNFLSLDSTPASLLMKEKIKLSGEVTVGELQSFDNVVQATLYRTDDPSLGAITLVFTEKPFTLVHWIVHDAQGNQTEVSLKNIKQNQKLGPNLFRAPS